MKLTDLSVIKAVSTVCYKIEEKEVGSPMMSFQKTGTFTLSG